MKHFYTFYLALLCIFSTNKKIYSSLVKIRDEELSSDYQPYTPSHNSPIPKAQVFKPLKRKRSKALKRKRSEDLEDLKLRILQEYADLRKSVLQEFYSQVGLDPQVFEQEINQEISNSINRDDQYPLPGNKIPFNPKPDRIIEYGLRRIFSYFGVHDSYIAVDSKDNQYVTEKMIIYRGILQITGSFYKLSEDEQHAYLLTSIFNLKNHATQTLKAMENQLEKIKENATQLKKAQEIIDKYHTLSLKQANTHALLTIATDPYHPLSVDINTALAVYKKMEESLNFNDLYHNLEEFVDQLPVTPEQTTFSTPETKQNESAKLAEHTKQIILRWLNNITPPDNNTIETLPDCDMILNQTTDATEQKKSLDEWIENMKKQ